MEKKIEKRLKLNDAAKAKLIEHVESVLLDVSKDWNFFNSLTWYFTLGDGFNSKFYSRTYPDIKYVNNEELRKTLLELDEKIHTSLAALAVIYTASDSLNGQFEWPKGLESTLKDIAGGKFFGKQHCNN